MDIEFRKKFFESYAQDNGFDPLIAENWYLQPRPKIMAYKVNFFPFLSFFCIL